MSSQKPKPILVLSFDGVLTTAAGGWQGPLVAADPPVPGMIAFLRAASDSFAIAVHSSRSGTPGGRSTMRAWLWEALRADPLATTDDERWFNDIEWPALKPAAFLTIDDRALTFTGEWPSIEALLAFKPWHKKEPSDVR